MYEKKNVYYNGEYNLRVYNFLVLVIVNHYTFVYDSFCKMCSSFTNFYVSL